MIVTCTICGIDIKRSPSQVERAKKVTCSITCAHLAMKDEGIRKRSDGYLVYYKDNTFTLIHRMIAEQKLGRKLRSNEVVHHIDGNRTNNDPNNLEVMTRADHISLHHKGEGHPNAILSDEDVVRMIELRHSGVLTKVIAKQFGISVHYCGEILQGIYRSDGWALYKEKHSGA